MDKSYINRNINVDKTLNRGVVEFDHKPLKINENERKTLKLNSNEMDLLVLKYYDLNNEKKEFIIGNLINSRTNEKIKDLPKILHNINAQINFFNLTSQTGEFRCRKLSKEIESAKNTFEKNFGIEYVPEGYDFFYGKDGYDLYDTTYDAKNSVIIDNEYGIENLHIFDDIAKEDLFKDKSYFENKIVTQEAKIVNEEVVTIEKRKDINEVKKYLGQLINSTDSLAEFFKSNPSILNDVAKKNDFFKKSLENWKQGKTAFDGLNGFFVFLKAGVEYVYNNEEMIENINLPDELMVNKETQKEIQEDVR